jgi:hypothetical protein
MKYAIVLGSAAALALAACSGSDNPAPEASETATAAATEAAAAPSGDAAAATGAAPTADYLVGKWGQAPDCSLPMTFNADGTITDGPTDKWTLTGNTLDLGGLFKMTLTVIDADTMETVNEGGGKTKLMRCK